ncbi:hypothetical protein C1H46_018070 [Malus baccata]|uniref:Uncharacterized protein n=1 Tax=Malus baccata TaxID=106549 RepID=A0A540MC39_MALBA|nr:hypothetical protein C1H46_018070 [Malus baccata]
MDILDHAEDRSSNVRTQVSNSQTTNIGSQTVRVRLLARISSKLKKTIHM